VTPDRISAIRASLAAVEGHPWKFSPKHVMFVGTTNAIEMYDRTIDIGRESKTWIPSSDPNVKGHTLSPESARKNATTKALGESECECVDLWGTDAFTPTPHDEYVKTHGTCPYSDHCTQVDIMRLIEAEERGR